MATIDTTIAHIMDEQDYIKIKSSKCWNSIRPPATLLTSNGRQICIRAPFWARIRLICTGKINNPPLSSTLRKIGPNNCLECRKELRVRQVVSELSLLGLCKGKRDGHAQHQHLHHQQDIATSSRITYEVYDNDLARVESKLPVFDGQLFMLACNVERKILENPTEQQAMLVPPITDVLQEVQNSPQNEKNDMFEMSLPSLANEEKADAPTLSEECIKDKLNGAEITQVDLHFVPRDKEELCDSTSLISIPQLVNQHATFNLDSPCTEFKHVIHTSIENDELQLQSSLNTLGYILFDDSCELNYLKDKIFAHSDLPSPRNIVLNRPRDENHMEKPRTVFRKEGEDDVTMATTDTTIAHIMDEQDDIKIKSSKCWNPIRPPTTLLTSNSRQICIRAPFWARIRLICTGKINNPQRGVSIAKAQHNVLYDCSWVVNVSLKS
uniref:Retrotransposon, putative, centromere-specific n=1 Tax=Oryza sativa subsp. japonica TaxID=39947 RepID=Q338Q7_ORYSJ|nr:retrotransposon, putative, centromere-specific [Oryza sativa Japonica Group]